MSLSIPDDAHLSRTDIGWASKVKVGSQWQEGNQSAHGYHQYCIDGIMFTGELLLASAAA